MPATGTALPASAACNRNSRSTACADGSSCATGAGLERITYWRAGVLSK